MAPLPPPASLDTERRLAQTHLGPTNERKLFDLLYEAHPDPVAPGRISVHIWGNRIMGSTGLTSLKLRVNRKLKIHLENQRTDGCACVEFKIVNPRRGMGYSLQITPLPTPGSFLRPSGSQATPRQDGGDADLLNARICKHGVSIAEDLRDPVFLRSLGDPLIFEDAILDGAIDEFTGVPPARLSITMTSTKPALPLYVLAKKAAIKRPEPNKKKVFLASWEGTISDKGSILELSLGRTDFWTSLAVEGSIKRIHADVLRNQLNLGMFPRKLDVVVVVLTADRRLVLCKRGGNVRYYPFHWEVSIGESMDASQDVGLARRIDPARTARRALREELGIPKTVGDEASLRFVSIGTEWPLLFANLVTIARLPNVDSGKLSD